MDIFTDTTKKLLTNAEKLAISRKNQQLTPEHILKVLLSDSDKHYITLVKASGGNLEKKVKDYDEELDKLPRVMGDGNQHPVPTQQFRKIISLNKEGDQKTRNKLITPEDLLFSIAINDDLKSSRILIGNGVSKSKLKRHIQQYRNVSPFDSPSTYDQQDALV